jgi:hypothetical protein
MMRSKQQEKRVEEFPDLKAELRTLVDDDNSFLQNMSAFKPHHLHHAPQPCKVTPQIRVKTLALPRASLLDGASDRKAHAGSHCPARLPSNRRSSLRTCFGVRRIGLHLA